MGQDKGLSTAASDTWISTKLKTKMLFDQKVSSINYNLHTIDGVVYLMGVAQDQAELDYVVSLARHTPKVKQVVSYVHVSKMAPPHEPTHGGHTGHPVAAPKAHPVHEPHSLHHKETQPSLNQPNASAFD